MKQQKNPLIKKHNLSFRKKTKIIKNLFYPAYKDRLYMTHLWVTTRCNIHCKFCYIRNYETKDPSLKELEKRLDKLKELGNRTTVIMGGEPTLRKDLPQIINACRKKDILSYLVTNGTLLNKKMIDKLGKNGLDIISISFDALDFKDSLLIRYGKYECDPKEKLDLLQYAQEKYDVMAFVAICITKLNLDEIIPLMKVAQKYNLAITLTVMANPFIIPNLKTQKTKKEKDPLLFKKIRDLKKLKKLIKKLKIMKKNGARIIEPYTYFNRILDFIENKEIEYMGCKAGKNFLDINTDGNIMLCVMSDPLPIHYSQLTKNNYRKKLKPYRKKQLQKCRKKCTLAAYLETSYYGDNLLEIIKTFLKIY
ncbi:MAG: radical SAM protein [Candidatus Moranbacteria bacterium]|nr:radical SAM protein [Candidatus Moranbacteria bacterium]